MTATPKAVEAQAIAYQTQRLAMELQPNAPMLAGCTSPTCPVLDDEEATDDLRERDMHFHVAVPVPSLFDVLADYMDRLAESRKEDH